MTETGDASLSKGRTCFTEVSTTALVKVSWRSSDGNETDSRTDMMVLKITGRQR